jgi:uncharacterized protein YchJ
MSDETLARLERWELRHGCELDDDEFGVLGLALEALPAHDGRFILEATGVGELHARLSRVLARGGLDAFVAEHRDAIVRAVPELEAALTGRPDAPAAAPQVEWHRDSVLARVEAAARTHSTLVLDLGTRIATVAVSRVLFRGSAVMVLGEDPRDGSDVAVPVSAIRAVAEPPPAGGSPRAAWRPAEGDRAPAGHAPCPCGSGRRYRACCRASN